MKRSQNREIVQMYMTRALPQLLSATEVDFLFEPHLTVEQTLEKLLSVSSQLHELPSGSGDLSISLGEGPIKDGIAWKFPPPVLQRKT